VHVVPRRYAQDERTRVGEEGKDRNRERQKQNRDGGTNRDKRGGKGEREQKNKAFCLQLSPHCFSIFKMI